MSALSQIVEDYLRLRRNLGHKLDEAGRQLPRLVAYLEAIGVETITLEAALACRSVGAAYWAEASSGQ